MRNDLWHRYGNWVLTAAFVVTWVVIVHFAEH